MRRFFSEAAVKTTKNQNTALYRVTQLQNHVDMLFAEPIAPREKKVMLVRHALSVGNVKHLIYGHGDYELTPEGVQQAMYLRNVLANSRDRFCDIYSSKLIRAYATGGIALGLGTTPSERDIKRDARFNEFDFGPLEGISTKKMDLFDNEFLFQMYASFIPGFCGESSQGTTSKLHNKFSLE